MAKSVLRCILVIAFLILIFGIGTNAFSATLVDAYGVLIGNGWTAKDALGFLGTSIAGTIAMNPSLAPAVAAGALSAYIAVKGSQLYDIYNQWRNIRSGIAVLNPIEYSQSMAVKKIRKGEYGWSYIHYHCWYYDSGKYDFDIRYREQYNEDGVLKELGEGIGYKTPKDNVINWINRFLTGSSARDPEGKALLNAVLQAGYNYLVTGTSYNVTYTREVIPALETGSTGVNASTLGYRVNVDPQSISEDGVNYLDDPDAFYQWFLSNYMNGSNEGTFVTPTIEAYDEIRTQLETIIDQLNNLSSTGGGVSEDTLNQLKTEILNAMNTRLSAVDTQLSGIDSKLTGVNTKLDGVDTKLTGVNTKLDGVDTKLDGVVSGIDTLSGEIGEINETLQEGLEQEQGFWDRLMEWLDETLFVKLRELLRDLFLPTQEQLDGLFNIELPEYQKNFAADISFSSESASIPISLFGANVNLAGYISQYASGLRTFMNIFVSGLAAIFVIRAFQVHLNID